MRTRRRHRRALVAAAAAAALLVPATLLGSVTAQADTPVTVIGVSADGTGHVHVYLDTGAGTQAALWVQVSILASSDAGASVLASTDAGTSEEYSQSGQNESSWTSDEPLRLPTDTPRAQYPVAVDFRMPTGTVQHWRSTNTPFDDRLRTSVAIASVDRTQLDFDHRTAVVAGTVTAYDPATGLTGPAAAGLTVAVVDVRAGPLATATTDTDGGFSVAVTPVGSVDAAVTVLDPPPDIQQVGDGYLPQITLAAEPVRIVGSPVSTRVHAGTSITIAGTAQRLSVNGWVALSGADIMTANDGYLSNVLPPAIAHGASDAAGHFSYRVTARRTTTLYTFVRTTPYLSQYNALASDVSVPVAAAYSGSFALNQYGTVSFRGRITGPCSGQYVTLQYSSTGRAGWTSVASGRAAIVTDLDHCSIVITGAGHAHGYYRVSSGESNGLLAYTGRATYLARGVTRITSWKLTPKRPRVNSRITSTGSVQQLLGTRWRGLRNSVVQLVFRPKGDSSYYLMATAHASASGRFSVRAKVYGDGYWAVVYRADSTHFSSETTVRYVDAR